jgi:hypothetical protein
MAVTIGAAVAALSLIVVLHWQSKRHVISAGFWFQDVTFDSVTFNRRFGGPIDEHEKRAIETLATSELRLAYSGLRVVFSDNRDVHYGVKVVQDFAPRAGPPGPAAQTRTLGPLGGVGAVSFHTTTGLAISYAPPDAKRATVVDAIGRGLGRAAAHEFAHLLLPDVNLHASRDAQSYEYASADRAAQYYGSIHWDTAWPVLLKRLGR